MGSRDGSVWLTDPPGVERAFVDASGSDWLIGSLRPERPTVARGYELRAAAPLSLLDAIGAAP